MSYETSISPTMYWAYSSAIALLGNESVVIYTFVSPLFRIISARGDDSCLQFQQSIRFICFTVRGLRSRQIDKQLLTPTSSGRVPRGV
jgi:hypothetical protein